ncbi:transcriptional corepressor LEUNIG-like [Sesamum indicum]|uniref:Transcriptional corepressor LEUNIG-like n=1 Tax=Sesamum indicum TaxID=4182 RepID=A0A6I9U6G4_SESIN|nr:transcriptional corepressor LEUNIG-like [Sesamum indicum]
MEEWDPQKMLDLYIYDYLIRKNLHLTAETFSREAGVHPKSVAIDPPEGFLQEWWSLFWDLYSGKLRKLAQEAQPSSSKATENAGYVPQNVHPVVPMPDVSYMLQNTCPAVLRPPFPHPLQNVSPPTMPSPDMGYMLQDALSAMMVGTELNPNRFGPTLIPDINMKQDQSITNFMAATMREQDHLRPPARDLNSNALDQLAYVLPSPSSSHAQKAVNSKRQLSLIRDDNVGTGLRGSTIGEPTHPSKLIKYNMERADTGRGKVGNIPSQGCSLTGVGYAADHSPVSNQQKQVSASAHFQQHSTPGLAAQASGKLIISATEHSTKPGSPALVVDVSKEKDLQVGKNAEMEKPLDEDIESFFSNDEAPEDKSTSFGRTFLRSSSAHETIDQQGFPFEQVRSLHLTKNKLLCCDFSTSGKFFAAAGHEKKVIICSLKQPTRHSILGHSQLITDIRFKPNSNMFATSSFDRSVKIWDAANPGRALFNFVGHAEHVMSVDFHPRNPNLLCSCDSNDEIRLWNVKESACFHSFKGANQQMRFQPRQGNLLAAASGNIIRVFEVETGIIHHRFEGHAKDVRSLCWDVCGAYLVSVSEDSARIWSVASGGKCVHELKSGGNKFASCTFHPAYSQVVAVGSYQNIDIWNPTMGNKTWSYQAHEGIISALANASETNMIASVSHDQWIKLWK